MTQVKISGIEEEVTVSNLFTKLGYFTRFHITIFPLDFKNPASDIDVFSIRFNSQLVPDINLIEVKGGKGKVPTLFQLYGFKTYFCNSGAYLIAEELYETTIDVAKKLGVKVLTFDRLKKLTTRDISWKTGKKSITVSLKGIHGQYIVDFLNIIREKLDAELFWKYHYLWLETRPYEKFYHLKRLFTKAGSLFPSKAGKKLREAFAWYRRELFVLSFLAAIQIASDCIDLKEDRVDEYVRNRFYNIGTTKEGKVKVQRGLERLLEQVKELTKGEIEIPPIEIIPAYVEDLLTLVKLIIENAPFVQSYLTINENISRTNLIGLSKNLKEFTTAKIQWESIRKINKLLLKILHQGPISIDFNDFF